MVEQASLEQNPVSPLLDLFLPHSYRFSPPPSSPAGFENYLNASLDPLLAQGLAAPEIPAHSSAVYPGDSTGGFAMLRALGGLAPAAAASTRNPSGAGAALSGDPFRILVDLCACPLSQSPPGGALTRGRTPHCPRSNRQRLLLVLCAAGLSV